MSNSVIYSWFSFPLAGAFREGLAMSCQPVCERASVAYDGKGCLCTTCTKLFNCVVPSHCPFPATVEYVCGLLIPFLLFLGPALNFLLGL
jgi:hypothetical protein